MNMHTDYDHFTSDFEYPDYEPLPDDYFFDHDLGVNYDVHICFNWKKLERLNKGNNTYKRFDPEFAHPDVAHNIGWYDPIHVFCNNKGYMNAVKKCEGIIRKSVGMPVCHALYKIKNHIEYRKSRTFRDAAKWFIEDLLNVDNDNSDKLNDMNLIVEDGIIKNKSTSICKVCDLKH